MTDGEKFSLWLGAMLGVGVMQLVVIFVALTADVAETKPTQPREQTLQPISDTTPEIVQTCGVYHTDGSYCVYDPETGTYTNTGETQ